MFRRSSGYAAGGEPELLVGLDLGTSKVTVVVAEREPDGESAPIIGVGQAPSNGIRKGLIVNLDQAVKSVRQAVNDAQNMVGQDIREVTVSFGGGEITNVRSKGMVSLGKSPRQVMQLDVERAIEAAQADVVVPANQTILHTIPVEYSLDGTIGIDDPLGMTAVRLDIQIQSIIVPTSTIQNVLNCVDKAGLSVRGLLIKPLASALGVLSPEDTTSSSVVIDIGGGTTSVSVFSDGRSKHLALIPVGGDHITNDIAGVLKLPLNKSEEIKKEVSAFLPPEDSDETIDFVYSGKSYSVLKADVHEITKCRLEELFDVLVRPEIRNSGISLFPSGVLLTGGVSKTEELDSFVLDLLQLSTSVSLPFDSEKMPPGRNTQEYASAAGIIRYVLEKERDPLRYLDSPTVRNISERTFTPPQYQKNLYDVNKSDPIERGPGIFAGLVESIKKLFSEFF